MRMGNGGAGLVPRLLAAFARAAPLLGRSDLIVTMPRRVAREFAALAPIVLVEPPLPIPSFTGRLWAESGQPLNVRIEELFVTRRATIRARTCSPDAR
jgi:hypothetical protein